MAFDKGRDISDQLRKDEEAARQITQLEAQAPMPVMAFTEAQMAQLLAKLVPANPGLTAEQLSQIVNLAGQNTATAMQKALKPENARAPEMSDLNPLGERDHPRPELKCKFTFGTNYPIERESCSRLEIDLLNRIIPGEYRVRETNGLTMTVNVKVRKATDMGEIMELGLEFPCKNKDQQMGVPPLASMLRDILGESTSDVLGLQDELDKLRKQNAELLAMATAG